MGAEYSDAKRRLLEKYLRGEVDARAETQQIIPRPRGERIPLSHAQEQVWVHAQMAPEVPLYNESVTIHYSGPLDLAALERSFNEILRRHEAWRTCFVVANGQPFQEVTEQLSISLPVIDLRTIPAEERDATAVAIATADARIPIDLGKTPLFRARLIQMADEEHRLYLTLSHIIFDGVAIYRVFLPELAALYEAYSVGESSSLPELAIQYPDYATWERRTFTREALAKDVEFWREKLSGPLPEVYLATDRPHPRSQSFRGSMYPFRLNGKLTTDLRNFCRREGVSLFHALLAGFAALLYRQSGEERIPIGSVTAGRNRPETTSLLGYFLNTVVVPADLSGEPSFRSLVQRARDWTIDALDHDRVPFDQLVRELKIARDPRHNPLFQALFSLEPPMPEVDPAWRLTQMDVDTGATKYDLYLELDERANEVLARFHYSTDLFERETMARMASDWQRLLEYGVADADVRLCELPVLNTEDERRTVIEWNRTEQSYPHACIHQLFESQAARSPEVVAVATLGLQLRYRELNERANQLAHYLVRRGVGPEVPVGLCLNRGAEMVVALLGVLKTGGPYVPLDSRLPDERLATMLADVKPKTIITDRSQHREVFGASAIHLDSDWKLISSESTENLHREMRPSSLAYVMYTSGSTGRPKGVAVEHRSVVNLLHSMQREPGLSPEDVLLAVTTLSFDIAGLEIFLPLITGARLFVASDADVVDGKRLGELLVESGATMMQATPTTWRLLIAAGWQGASNLTLLCGGEELTPDLAQQLARRCGSVWNVYGPTETTIWSSMYRVRGNEENTVPIGRPLANTSIYILDAHHKPVPVNVTGEIYIGGDGVARGYLNRPELTAERFVSVSVEAEKSARLYRTGDLGRFRANGNIEYLGRLDNQIKLRGQRMELGEIESVLASHPAVGRAVVTLSGNSADQQKLSAYVVAKAGVASPAAGELRRHLRTKLPEHMVPSSFSQIESVPQLPSGKVNRPALTSIRSAPLLDQEELVAPRNEVETKLAEIWRDLLEVKQVGIEQNFFELGGHSLLALQETARIRRAFEVELPVRSIFEAPTIAALAIEVEKARGKGLKTRPRILRHRHHAVRGDAGREVFPASFAQERLWFLDQFEPGTGTYNMPCLFRIIGPLRVDVLTRAFRAVVQRHASLRAVFDSVDGEARQVVLPHLEVKVPIIDLTQVPEGERESEALRVASEEGKKAFDLREGPLLRTLLVRLEPETCILLIVMHHIISDGWSISRLFHDVTKCYAAFLENTDPELPDLPVQYTDYAQWQREYMSGEVLSQEVQHWEKTLAGAQTVLDLATDHPRPAAQTWNGARKEITLDVATLGKMKAMAQNETATLYMVSMAAFQALLWRYTQQESILVGTPTGARNDVELEEMIGLFVNTLVFRADFTSQLTFRDLIRQVRSFALEAYMHQDLPFEKLVEELVPQRSLDTPPLFQAMFIFQNIPPQVFEISGLSIKQMSFETGIAKFDLSAELWEDTELHCQFEYNTDLFERSTIQRMLGNFETLIGAALANPDLPLAQLPILSAREREQILVEWNRTTTDYSRAHPQPCIHELFESQVEQSPDAVAVVSGEQELTYRELNQRANQLAWYLLKGGVGREVPVCMSLDRGPGMMVALLGILKAGGAYVPLDPRLPDDRLSFMLADVKPRMVLTEQKMQRGVFGTGTVLLDTDWDVIAQESTENPNQKLSSDSLAYVMFTSGSTGRPKGVLIEHGGVVNLLRSMQREPGITRDDVLLALAIISFDMATPEMYLPLISGARIVIGSLEDAVDGNRLRELMSRQGVTFMQATPATCRLLLAAGWEGSPDLKLLCGAEAVPAKLALDLIPRCKSVWNVYGPTETTVWSSVYRVTGREEGSIPIGRPIANTSIYILDSTQNPVPVNVAGEIYIGGEGLARGYLNRPELAAERFVANPLGTDPSSKLYRTGDLGRFRFNGEIEYLGRVDNQVKLRGFRIELGEIESVLASHATLQEAVVNITGEGEQQKLCAYVVVNDGKEAPSAGELRRHLRAKLPEYMVPSGYWRVEKMPLGATGKVDRGALAALSATALREEAELVAPRNEMEAKLAEIWQELLQVEQLGIEQNFFELGGHSLLALQVTARIRRTFEVELPVRSVFEAPTIAGLAGEVQKAQALGLKVKNKIPQHSANTRPADADQEELLTQLDKLPAQEVRSLLKDLLDGKNNYEFRS